MTSRHISIESSTNNSGIQRPERVSIRSSVETLLDSKALILFVTALVVLAGLGYIFFTQPLYSADVVMQITPREDPQTGSELGKELTAYGAVSPISAEMQLLRSRLLMGQVVDDINLTMVAKPHYAPFVGAAIARWRESREGFTREQIDLGTNTVEREIYAWGGDDVTVERFDVPQFLIGEEFKITALSDDKFSLRKSSGKEILRGVVGSLVTSANPAKEVPISILISSLEAPPGTLFKLQKLNRAGVIERLQGNLKIREKGPESGILQVLVTSTDSQLAANTVNKLADIFVSQSVDRQIDEIEKNIGYLKSQIPVVKTNLEKYEAELKQFRMNSGSVDLTTETRTALERIVTIGFELREQNQKRKEVRIKFTSSHPTIKAIDAQIKLLRGEQKKLENVIAEIPKIEQQVLRLTRNIEVAATLYKDLLIRTQELEIAKSGAVSNVRVLDYAIPSTEPIKPLKKIILLISAVLGLLLGILLVFLKRLMIPGIEDPSVIENRLDLPVYATIPHSKSQKRISRLINKRSDGITALECLDHDDIAIESLRSLRNALQFSKSEAKNNILLVTGPGPKVGKSFVSLNLAILFARGGERVLLVDADMRRGRLNRALNTVQKPGLSELIVGQSKPDAVICETQIKNLSFLPTGGRPPSGKPPNASELLLYPSFAVHMGELAHQFDYIILDSAPVLAVADAGILGNLAGATLLIVKSGVNPLQEIAQCKKQLLQTSANIKGVVINDIDMSGRPRSKNGYVYRYDYSV